MTIATVFDWIQLFIHSQYPSFSMVNDSREWNVWNENEFFNRLSCSWDESVFCVCFMDTQLIGEQDQKTQKMKKLHRAFPMKKFCHHNSGGELCSATIAHPYSSNKTLPLIFFSFFFLLIWFEETKYAREKEIMQKWGNPIVLNSRVSYLREIS